MRKAIAHDCTHLSGKGWQGRLIVLLSIFACVSSAWAYTIYSVYTLSGGSATQTNQTYTTSSTDTSGVYVNNGANLTLVNPVVMTSGNSSSGDDSSFYGLNAGILAASGGSIQISGGAITTTGLGANGIFATGSGSIVTVEDTTIYCTGRLGHGVDATLSGTLIVKNVTATTTGANGSVIATDRGSGTITVTGGTYTAGGNDSAGIYSTGVIKVTGATVGATGGEAVVIEGGNSATLVDTAIFGAAGTRDRGILIYNSQSGDAESGDSYFTMTGGSYTWPSTTGPAFYVTNQTTTITLTGVTVNSQAEKLLYAAAGNWGKSGSNGGNAIFNASNEALTGDLIADSISTITASLKNNTALTGATSRVAMTLDETSSWIVDANSALSSLTNAGKIQFDSSGLTLTDSGDLSTTSTGQISILLGGESNYNTIIVAGKATLAGTLNVIFADGFIPTVGQTFTIMTYGSKSGSFTSLLSEDSGLEYTIEYGTTSAVITITSAPTSTNQPTSTPSNTPGITPTFTPTNTPMGLPTSTPTSILTGTPFIQPTGTPGNQPTGTPPAPPEGTPGNQPTGTPPAPPEGTPGNQPTGTPVESIPTNLPTSTQTNAPKPTWTPTPTVTATFTWTPTKIATPNPTPTPTVTPTFIPLPNQSAWIADNLATYQASISGATDYDEITNRVLIIAFNDGNLDVRDRHIYVSVDGGDDRYIGQTGNGTTQLFEWKPGVSRWDAALAVSPQYGHRYSFKVYALKSNPSNGRPFYGPYQAGSVDFRQQADLIVTDDLLTFSDLSNDRDTDSNDGRALVLRWNYDSDFTVANVKDYHVYVRINGKGGFTFLGRTGNPSVKEFVWEPTTSALIKSAFQAGPQFGNTYEFRLYALKKAVSIGERGFYGPFQNAGPVTYMQE